MPTFTYTDDEPRVYPDLAVEVSKGDTVTADTNPDEHRFDEGTAVPVEKPAKQKTSPPGDPE